MKELHRRIQNFNENEYHIYIYHFTKFNRRVWSVGCCSPTYRGKNETTRSCGVEARPDYTET